MDLWMDVDTALSEVPVNFLPLLDDTDFKTKEESVVYNQAGMDLVWNFVTTGGVFTQTAVVPTSGGVYDWTNQGNGMYSIEIPSSGGGSINNDAEGFGWFTGVATGILPWRGPVIGFRAEGLNNLLIDNSFSATRGLAGTALPAAAADAAGGLPISDDGGLDIDTLLAHLNADISSRAAPGAEMDLVDAPNSTAIAVIQSGLALASALSTVGGNVSTILGRIIGTIAAGTHVAQTGDSFARIGANGAGLTALAQAATALSNATWTNARAGYLDNSNVGGLLASQADVQAITQASRVRISVPGQLERPDSGSTPYRVWIYSYNELHQAEDLDSNPTVTAENNAGVDRSSNLGTVTKPGGTTGQYYVDYTLSSGDAIEGLVFKVNATEGGDTTQYPASTMVVDTTAADFTATDRANLLSILQDTGTDIPAQIDGLNDLSSAEAQAASAAALSAYDPPTNTEMEARTLPSAGYFDPSTDEVTTDAASQEASKADVSALATADALSVVGGNVDDIKAVTGEIPDSGAMTSIAKEATLTARTLLAAAYSTLTAANVNAEVVDALNVDTYAQPGQGVPPSEMSVRLAISYLIKWAMNKHDINRDTSEERHYAADGVTVDQKRSVSDDDTTATKGAMESGA